MAFQEAKQRAVRALMFSRCLILFRWFFRVQSFRAESDSGGANFYIFVPSLGLPNPLPELDVALPLQGKKLSDVMASDH